MIYITGDCHGNVERFEPYIFPEQAEMTKDDYVINLWRKPTGLSVGFRHT